MEKAQTELLDMNISPDIKKYTDGINGRLSISEKKNIEFEDIKKKPCKMKKKENYFF